MTIQKQLSYLSFAAIMLVFAALPALAQTGSVDNQTAVAITSNLDQVAALRKERVSIPAKESPIVVAPVVTEKQQPSFSVAQFMKSAAKPAVISDSQALEFTSLEKPRNDTSKSLTFVPSRGPKFPWQ